MASIVSTTKASGGFDQAHPHSGHARKSFPLAISFTNTAKPALAQTEQSPAEYMDTEAITSPAQRSRVQLRAPERTRGTRQLQRGVSQPRLACSVCVSRVAVREPSLLQRSKRLPPRQDRPTYNLSS